MITLLRYFTLQNYIKKCIRALLLVTRILYFVTCRFVLYVKRYFVLQNVTGKGKCPVMAAFLVATQSGRLADQRRKTEMLQAGVIGFCQYSCSSLSPVWKNFYKRLLGACWALIGRLLDLNAPGERRVKIFCFPHKNRRHLVSVPT